VLPVAAGERVCLPALKPRCCLPIASWTTTVCECCVAEAVDWRKRHLDALREMESEERRWRGVEQILRRLVSRVCAVAMGRDPRLDVQLDTLSAAARRNTDEAELKALFDSLTGVVMAVEKSTAITPPPPPPPTPSLPKSSLPPSIAEAPSPTATPVAGRAPFDSRWQSSCEAVAMLIDRLGQADPSGSELGPLRSDLAAVANDGALALILLRVSDLVSRHIAAVTRERGEAVATLAQVTDRLSEMAQYLTGASAERERDHEDRQTLNIDLLAQMTRLSDEVKSHDDLSLLRVLVTDRLDTVANNVRDFREREQHRFAENAARSERMLSRLAALENESRELHRNLDLEKQRSRIDTLTRVANRVSFDERFAEELSRWNRFRHPVAILVWDIDRFKSINDACGHRGGDAVLREVAVALSRGRRGVDFFARFGGEEFVSLLVGTELADALRTAEEMRSAVEALRFHFHGSPVRVTVSCGLTALREGDSADTVFDRADAALYKAKNSGRNVCIAV
jgi:diguanylate cyclase